jgi:hypothetical protein
MTIGSVEHLGETVRPGKYGYRLTRKLYALPNKRPSVGARREDVSEEQWAADAWAYEDDAHTSYTDEVCDRQRARALENFDFKMQSIATGSAATSGSAHQCGRSTSHGCPGGSRTEA